MSRRRSTLLVAGLGLVVGFLSTAGNPVLPAPGVTTFPDFMYATSLSADATRHISPGQATNKPAALAVGIGPQTACAGVSGSTLAGRTSRVGSPGCTQAGTTADKGTMLAARAHRAPVALFGIATTVAGRRRVPVHILAGLIEDESTWNVRAKGKHGEIGLLQLKAATAKWCGGRVNRFDAADNIDCGARYLYAQFERFGTWQMAIVAFKAGPERIPDRIPASSWAFALRALLKSEAYR